MLGSADESTNEKPLSIVSYNTLTPMLSLNEEEMFEEISVNNDQSEITHNRENDVDRSDSLTESFIKMQNQHIDQSKSNKYEYTPLQFAKSLFDRMIADGGVASERKEYAQYECRDAALNSFVTPDVSLIKKNYSYMNMGNENPILNALKLNAKSLNNSNFVDPHVSYQAYQETPLDTAKLAQKYFDKIYVNGNYVQEFNSEYDDIDRNMNSSFIPNQSLNIATPNTMPNPISMMLANTTPQDIHCLQRKNLLNVLEEHPDENVDAINQSCHIISPSKLLNLDAKINRRMSFNSGPIENFKNYPIDNSNSAQNNALDERTQLSRAKNPLTDANVINRNKSFSGTFSNKENYDQVDAFKNYVITGKVDDNLSSKLKSSNTNNSLIKIPDNHIEPLSNITNCNNIPNVKPRQKSSKMNIFKRLFKRLRHKNRFYSHLSNDTITSLNTEFNRSHLNKTTSDLDSNQKYSLNTSMEADFQLMKSHSKSVMFAPTVQSGDSLIEEFDRDQQYYDSLKQQANISNKISMSNGNLTKEGPIRCSNRNGSSGSSTVLTFYIGADDVPFKTEIRVDPHVITLKMIKNVLPKLGKRTKYYFKKEDSCNGNGYYTEISNDSDLVPLFEGQPVCKFFSHC